MAGIDRWLHYTVTTIDRFHCICMTVCMYMYVCTYVRMYVCMHVCMYV